MTVAATPWNLGAPFPNQTTNQARYGMSYLESVCAHYGVPCLPTPADADVMAIDATIPFADSDTRIQVKCTTRQFTERDPHISWPVTDAWVEQWRRNKNATYLVLVVVPQDLSQWVDYTADLATLHHTAAYWAQVNNLPEGARSVRVPKHNRFTALTLRDWSQNLGGGYGVEQLDHA